MQPTGPDLTETTTASREPTDAEPAVEELPVADARVAQTAVSRKADPDTTSAPENQASAAAALHEPADQDQAAAAPRKRAVRKRASTTKDKAETGAATDKPARRVRAAGTKRPASGAKRAGAKAAPAKASPDAPETASLPGLDRSAASSTETDPPQLFDAPGTALPEAGAVESQDETARGQETSPGDAAPVGAETAQAGPETVDEPPSGDPDSQHPDHHDDVRYDDDHHDNAPEASLIPIAAGPPPEPARTVFADLGLSAEVLRAIDDMGYRHPTPIQEQAIPYVLMGRDVMGTAQTGTGKTAGFTLPMLDILSGSRARARMPRSLILEPTRELALQVAENFVQYGKYLKLTHALIIGGESMSDQKDVLNRGVDVLIATPGRLLDMFDRGTILLSDTKLLVIDEADRMLDMGFIPDVERIVSMLPGTRQTLFFSATMGPEIRRLVDAFLTNPKEIAVSRAASVATTITEGLALVAEHDKREGLRRLIRSQNVQNALIFCNRKRDVDILYKSLTKHHFNAGALHGDMAQTVRFATLEKFKANELRLLVCSDVAARGLDIGGLSHVFNFDVPIHAEDYVHRIGRTGRAGLEGKAFTIASPDDRYAVEQIEKLIGHPIPPILVEGLDPVDWAERDGRKRRGRKSADTRKSSDKKPARDNPARDNKDRPRSERTRPERPRFDRDRPQHADQPELPVMADERPPRREDTHRDDGRRSDSRRPDERRADRGRTDQGRGEPGRADQGRSDQGRGEPGRGDQGRGDQGRADQGRGDQGRGEPGRAE